MKVKTSDLIGPALDWAVAKCEGRDYHSHECTYATDGSGKVWAPGVCPFEDGYSTSWPQGGPIIEREKITLRTNASYAGPWAAFIDFGASNTNIKARKSGPTPLIAAMRCYVTSKLGEEVEVPEELLH